MDLAALARHRVLTRTRLRRAGLTDEQIDGRVATGVLRREHRGVYSLGAPVDTFAGRALAAVLALGGTARASHRAAGALHGLLEPGPWPIDVTVGHGRRPIAGVVVHRTRAPDPRWCLRDRVPCTGVSRTLADLAGGDVRQFERAWRVADARRLLALPHLEAEVRRGRAGGGVLAAALARHRQHGTPRTESELEDAAADLFRPPALPMPETNVTLRVEGRRRRVDCLWREERVVVELDSRRWHSTPAQRAAGAQRTLELQLAGYCVVPLTWTDVHDGADRTLARLARLLSLRRGETD